MNLVANVVGHAASLRVVVGAWEHLRFHVILCELCDEMAGDFLKGRLCVGSTADIASDVENDPDAFIAFGIATGRSSRAIKGAQFIRPDAGSLSVLCGRSRWGKGRSQAYARSEGYARPMIPNFIKHFSCP